MGNGRADEANAPPEIVVVGGGAMFLCVDGEPDGLNDKTGVSSFRAGGQDTLPVLAWHADCDFGVVLRGKCQAAALFMPEKKKWGYVACLRRYLYYDGALVQTQDFWLPVSKLWELVKVTLSWQGESVHVDVDYPLREHWVDIGDVSKEGVWVSLPLRVQTSVFDTTAESTKSWSLFPCEYGGIISEKEGDVEHACWTWVMKGDSWQEDERVLARKLL